MRDHLRVTTLSLTLLALLAAGPLAAGANPTHAATNLTVAGEDSSWSTAWLHRLWSWLGGALVSAGPEAAAVSSSFEAAASSQEPASPDPDFDPSPNCGPAIDPNG